ncbi:Crp/Fnr family transcriptional regulator [Jiella marina]|uniref:Crp/Fnr family transcriptional regulator n=1 Tax=Jiella sp. LLJ827 TaxID=2917712 RepID=UPI0021008720|nr:helix-turn-helix domain-containing protein [Jiella sp. LLJ827]MCQ0989329.1 helix-turn-helix domain-containing protein [Jiella sp. LLJ827]
MNQTMADVCQWCRGSNRSVCAAVPLHFHEEIRRISHIRTFEAGTTIASEGHEALFVGTVLRGVLRLVKTLADGRQQIVGLLFASDMFGRVFSDEMPFAIEAATKVELCMAPRRRFETLLSRHHELEHEILIRTLDELDAGRNWMVVLGCQNMLERVAAFLAILTIREHVLEDAAEGSERAAIVEVPLSRADMAAYLGTTLETVSRSIHRIADHGAIEIIDPRQFLIKDWPALLRLSGRSDLTSHQFLGRFSGHDDNMRTLSEAC